MERYTQCRDQPNELVCLRMSVNRTFRLNVFNQRATSLHNSYRALFWHFAGKKKKKKNKEKITNYLSRIFLPSWSIWLCQSVVIVFDIVVVVFLVVTNESPRRNRDVFITILSYLWSFIYIFHWHKTIIIYFYGNHVMAYIGRVTHIRRWSVDCFKPLFFLLLFVVDAAVNLIGRCCWCFAY